MAVEFASDDYYKHGLDWYEAKLYCFSLNIDGNVGWRLPTISELAEEDWGLGLCDNDLAWWVWTSDSVESRYFNVSKKDPQQYAYQYDLIDNELYAIDKKESGEVWVFPVRDLEND